MIGLMEIEMPIPFSLGIKRFLKLKMHVQSEMP